MGMPANFILNQNASGHKPSSAVNESTRRLEFVSGGHYQFDETPEGCIAFSSEKSLPKSSLKRRIDNSSPKLLSKKSKSKRKNGSMKSKRSSVEQPSLMLMEMRNTKIVPKGLQNLGNTCFYNSASQCLLNTHHFQFYSKYAGENFSFTVPECSVVVYEKTFRLQASSITVEFEEETPFIQVFKRYVDEYYSGRSMNPRPVFNEVAQRAPRFRGWHQQDSHELLRYLIDGLRQEEVDAIERSVKRHLKSQKLSTEDLNLVKRAYMNFAKPFIDRVFGGTLLQIVRCSECKHDSVSFEPFLDLSLSIPKDVDADDDSDQHSGYLSKSQKKKFNRGTSSVSIHSALKRFTGAESLRDSNAYKCVKCCAPENKNLDKRSKTVSARKRYLIYTLPPVLTLHLKRFEKTQQYGRIRTNKVSDHVDFPLILDMKPYCSDTVKSLSEGQTKFLYSLYGIVCHSGSLSGGHYIAYVKSRKPIEHVEKFFKEASRFDASVIGDFERYEELESDSAVKSRPEDNMTEEEALASLDSSGVWYYCSDSHVQSVSQEQVLSAEAYLLFYERFY